MALQPGRRVAIDVGTVRVGLAQSDSAGISRRPLPAVAPQDLPAKIAKMAEADQIAVIYVGLPKHLSGVEGESAANARRIARSLAENFELPVRLVDERLTTKSAVDIARANPELARFDIDSIAALSILEFALDGERNQGGFFGEAI
ncbi:MAG: hypothetical protein RLZZ79_331 [Actinomycetota bacterium]